MNRGRAKILTLWLLCASGCAGAAEQAAWKDAAAGPPAFAGRADENAGAPGTAHPLPSEKQLSLDSYIKTAMKRSPELKAAFARWQASVLRISQSRKLPDPQLSFGLFVQSVETRVGPQRAKLSLQQSFPWPSKLTAGADSAASQARAQQRRFDALALSVKYRVETAYWKLWLVREAARIRAEHLLVVRSLSESVLARVATGAASLAEQQQVDLAAARMEDQLRSMAESEATVIAELHAAMGTQEPAVPPTPTEPPPALLPRESHESLQQAVRAHPFIQSFAHLAESSEELARARQADRFPNFSIGADWVITGESRMPGVADSGKDAVMVGAGLTLPLWQGISADQEDAAKADATAQRADLAAAENQALAELEASLAAIRDGVRRVQLYQSTLVPQADSAYASVLGAYATGRGTVAQTLLAQRELLELRGELEKARADTALGWTRLEQVVGRAVSAAQSDKNAPSENNDGRK